MSGFDLAVDHLQEQVNDLKQEFSELRKKGIDVSLPYLKFLNIQSKIGIAKATQGHQDVQKANALILEVKMDLEDAKRKKEDGSKKNEEKSYMQRIDALVEESCEAVKKGDRERLLRIYIEVRGLYPFISGSLKKETYKKCLELYSELQKKRS